MTLSLERALTPTGMNEGDVWRLFSNLVDLINELQANHATTLTLNTDLKALLNAQRSLFLNHTLVSGALVIGTGATTSYRHSVNGTVIVAGKLVAMGAAADHAFTAAHVITQNLWGVALITMNAAGTFKSTVPLATQAYTSEALAIAAMPAVPANEAVVGYITIRARSTVDFTGNTTTLTADNGVGNSQTVNYVQGGYSEMPSMAAVASSPPSTLTNITALRLSP